MSHVDIDCFLIKHDEDVIGVSLVTTTQNLGCQFCSSMPEQLINGKGKIEMRDGEITFVNPPIGKVSFHIADSDSLSLKRLLEYNQELCIYTVEKAGLGFKIVPEGSQKVGNSVKLTYLWSALIVH